MKKLLILLFILCIPLIAAEPAFTFQKDVPVDIKVPVFDDDKAPVGVGTECNITIRYPNSTILIQNVNMTFNAGGIYNVTLTASNTSAFGEYAASMGCSDGTLNGFSTFTFEVTQSGFGLSTGQSIIYVIFLAAIIFTFLLSLWGAWRIPFKNKVDTEGKIITVNELKYVKIFLIVTTYTLLLFIFGVTKSITENFLFLNGAHTVFEWLYWLLYSFIWPLIVVSLLLTVIWFLDGKKLKKALIRGVPMR